jgi:hypothetical protein
MSRTASSRAVLAMAALVLVPACSRDTEFEIVKTFDVHTTALAHGPDVQAIDLAKEAGAAWDHRDRLKSVKVTAVSAVASNVAAPGGATGSGTVALRPSGAPTDGSADVLIGSFAGPVVDGVWISAGSAPGLDATMEEALQGNGVLSFVLEGNATSDFDATVEVRLQVQVEYSVF